MLQTFVCLQSLAASYHRTLAKLLLIYPAILIQGQKLQYFKSNCTFWLYGNSTAILRYFCLYELLFINITDYYSYQNGRRLEQFTVNTALKKILLVCSRSQTTFQITPDTSCESNTRAKISTF